MSPPRSYASVVAKSGAGDGSPTRSYASVVKSGVCNFDLILPTLAEKAKSDLTHPPTGFFVLTSPGAIRRSHPRGGGMRIAKLTAISAAYHEFLRREESHVALAHGVDAATAARMLLVGRGMKGYYAKRTGRDAQKSAQMNFITPWRHRGDEEIFSVEVR